MGRGECITDQWDSQGKEPGINEKVVSTNLDDVQKQRGDRQQDTLGHNKLLYSILEEEPYCLSRTEDNSKTAKDTIRMCVSGGGEKYWKHLVFSKVVYLLIKTMLLLNNKCVVQTPRKSSQGTEQGGKHQKYEGLGDLILWAKSKAGSRRTSNAPQKGDSTQEQDQLQGFKHNINLFYFELNESHKHIYM